MCSCTCQINKERDFKLARIINTSPSIDQLLISDLSKNGIDIVLLFFSLFQLPQDKNFEAILNSCTGPLLYRGLSYSPPC